MCAYELFVLILFICAIALVYVPALVIIGSRVVRRIRNVPAGQPGSASKQFNLLEGALLFVALIGAVLLSYGYFIEPYWVEVTRVQITSPKLANFSNPIKVVQISDLHCDPVDRVESKLSKIIAAEKPDAIIFTGDAINSRKALGLFKTLLKSLSTIAPTFAVDGNHDSRCWSDLNLYKNTNVTALNGQSVKLSVGGQDVYLAGVGVDSEAKTAQALKAIPSGAFTLFLYHSPDLIADLAQRHIDLVCVGHTHGGQVRLPLYGAIITESRYGKQYEAGLYRVRDSWMYVNRGIGMEGGMDPRVRFLARPEVTVFELMPNSRAANAGGKASI